ncbi:MAG: hypothetical protein HUJ95_05940, partial [Bacteroidales bacterium]|nr:hypothetical protein [Bacteroidales bacterium]
KNVILALDTLAYDSEKNLYDYVVKDPAKVVVLSSMYSDVASEIRKINKYYKHNIKVFEQGTVLREYISSRYTENSYIAVWGRKETLEGEFYHDMATSLGLRTYSAMDFETDWKSAKEETDTLLFRYLDTLASRRPHSKVSCVVIDDHTLAQRASALNAKIATLTQSEDPAILKYANLLAKDFRFINPMDVISGELYKYMRQENLFTHRVDTPLFTSFVTLNNGGEYALANFTYGQ